MSGWDEALKVSREMTGKALPLARLLADAIDYAEERHAGHAPAGHATASKFDELKHIPGFAETFLVDGKPPESSGAAFASPPGIDVDARRRTVWTALPRPAGGRTGARHGDVGLPVTLSRFAARTSPARLRRWRLRISGGDL